MYVDSAVTRPTGMQYSQLDGGGDVFGSPFRRLLKRCRAEKWGRPRPSMWSGNLGSSGGLMRLREPLVDTLCVNPEENENVSTSTHSALTPSDGCAVPPDAGGARFSARIESAKPAFRCVPSRSMARSLAHACTTSVCIWMLAKRHAQLERSGAARIVADRCPDHRRCLADPGRVDAAGR